MSQNGTSAADLTALQQALLTIAKLQNKLAAQSRGEGEAIAIVGMGCRLAGGVDGPERLRELLWQGREALSAIPAGRGALQGLYDPDPAKPGKACMRRAGFIDDVDSFDAEFFHITRREAEGIDPQQRLFLEVSWEALEHAGIAPDRLAGTRTGVFAGVHAKDYAHLGAPGLEKIGAHYSTGVDASYVAGRLAYFLGLEGPVMTIDTACSSSLVAVHQACQSLRTGESKLAIAGGVKLLLSPHLSVFLSKAGALSPAGHCRAFDRAADGMVQGEGCGVVILKRLKDAEREGDRILAVIRGSAVNHNGASGGLTVPSPRAQEALYRLAIEQARVSARDIDYLEAHGTGTRLGDPIELQGVARVYGAARTAAEDPLWIGSSKPNVGHTEAAAGVAGLLKAVLVLQAGEVPPAANFESPTSGFAWDGSAMAVAREGVLLRRAERPHLAAVSSFGMSGVNAHAIVEARDAARESGGEAPYVLVLSARSDAALRQLAARYARWFAGEGDRAAAYDRCATAGMGRAHHDARIAIVAGTDEELASRLRAAAEGREERGVLRGRVAVPRRSGPVFVFGGELARSWQPKSVLALLRQSDVFRERARAVDAHFRRLAGGSVLDRIGVDGDALFGVDALFLVQVALTDLWRSYGVEPAGIHGHGAGAIAASVIAGRLSIEEGVRRVASGSFAAAGEPVAPGAEGASDAGEEDGVVVEVPAAAPDGDVRYAMLSKVGELYCAGFPIRFEGVYPGGRRASLPTYPWQRERYWWDEPSAPVASNDASAPASSREASPSAADELFFEIAWNELPPIGAEATLAGTWLIVSERPEEVEPLAARLSEAGGNVITAHAGPRFEKLSPASYRLDLADVGAFARLLRDLSGAVGILVCSSSSAGDPATFECPETLRAKAHGEAVAVTSLVQAIAQVGWLKAPRLYLITRGAQPVTAADHRTLAIAAAPLWGLGRVLAYEHPELRCTRIDRDPADSNSSSDSNSNFARDILSVLRARDAAAPEDEVAFRGGRRFVASLQKGRHPSAPERTLRLRSDRTYLVTGGLGGIGLRLAAWLVARGACHLALFGRKAESPTAREALEPLRAAGAQVHTFRVDVSSTESVAGALAILRRDLPPLAGVFHSAGVLDDGSILRLEPWQFSAVMAPKVQGAWNLHTLLTEPSIELFVLFSSTASMIGAPGQANYAAANAFLDALAHLRRGRGQPALSLQWGSWGEVGMAAADHRRGERLAGRGMRSMSVDEALLAMEIAILEGAERPAARGVAALDPEAWCRSHPTVSRSSLFRELVAERALPEAPRPPRLRDELLTLASGERHRALEARLKEMVGDVSGVSPERLSTTASFVTIGIDSVMSLELRDLVTERLEVSLPLVSFVDESTIEGLANELLQHFAAASVLGTAPAAGQASTRILL
ncbi:SDR family NAD(P)-dependent oxidoreductase [Pendulispora albinea]|uniref:Type I polyketide synthase n=1 Tax=Pendulispora albinea TaxID=2741071 RepID=A0ABZ2M3A0_9BACT